MQKWAELHGAKLQNAVVGLDEYCGLGNRQFHLVRFENIYLSDRPLILSFDILLVCGWMDQRDRLIYISIAGVGLFATRDLSPRKRIDRVALEERKSCVGE